MLREYKPCPMKFSPFRKKPGPKFNEVAWSPHWEIVLGIQAPWYGDEHFADYGYLDATPAGNGPVIDNHSGWLVVPEGL